MKRLAVLVALIAYAADAQAADPAVEFAPGDHKLGITIGGKPFATYVTKDDTILRPFFAHVHAPDGAQVTRNHPPIAGKDATDHAANHPGLWLAFGDLSGADFWRNRGTIRHVDFTQKPKEGPGRGEFSVKNRYESGGKTLGDEICKVTILVRPAGYLLLLDSTFTGDFVFGDQEEMGLGVRVASLLAVAKGGSITNSDGRKNEKQAWGKQADWCEYGGMLGGKRVGVVLMPDPRNFRRSWFHARDYGVLVANPFGQNAFTRGKRSSIAAKDEPLRLRFGVLTYSGEPDVAAAYKDYLGIVSTK